MPTCLLMHNYLLEENDLKKNHFCFIIFQRLLSPAFELNQLNVKHFLCIICIKTLIFQNFVSNNREMNSIVHKSMFYFLSLSIFLTAFFALLHRSSIASLQIYCVLSFASWEHSYPSSPSCNASGTGSFISK